MVKLIIIAYNYYPQSKTAAQRPYAWIKHMHEYGVYPILITRNWNKKVANKIEVEKTSTHSIYKIDTKKLLVNQGAKNIFVRKLARFADDFLFSSYLFGPYQAFHKQAKKIIEETDGDKILLVTVQPFGLLRLAHHLHKETGIDWIADYRDDWTTTELLLSGRIKKILTPLVYQKLEKKWLATAKLVTSVSDYYVEKILNLSNQSSQQGLTVENGYFESEHPNIHAAHSKMETLSFLYVGSLYSSQDILPLLQTIKQIADDIEKRIDFIFLGTLVAPSRKELFEQLNSAYFRLIFKSRIPKVQALALQNSCHYAVICPHTGLRGVPSSKLYEFIGAQMPVIFYPNDYDIIEHNLLECNLGITGDTEKELYDKLKELVLHRFIPTANAEKCKYFSRRNSTKILSEKIQELF